jgi:hypothetical protein
MISENLPFTAETEGGPQILNFSSLVEAWSTLDVPELSLLQKQAFPAFAAYTAELDRSEMMGETGRIAENKALIKLASVAKMETTRSVSTPMEIGMLPQQIDIAFGRMRTLNDQSKLKVFAGFTQTYLDTKARKTQQQQKTGGLLSK